MKSVFFYRLDLPDLPGELRDLGAGIGEAVVGIAEEGGAVTEVFFGDGASAGAATKWAGSLRTETPRAETPLIKEAALQIRRYLAGGLREFSLPLAMRGTEFQASVWRALQGIPYGETRSYKEVAAGVGRPKAVRAVGLANNRNPISIIVPCHRVIGHQGSLVGYGGGLPLKRYLLGLESRG